MTNHVVKIIEFLFETKKLETMMRTKNKITSKMTRVFARAELWKSA